VGLSALSKLEWPDLEIIIILVLGVAGRIRLEAKVSDRLQAMCRENAICREVLIEAMFEYCELNPEALSAVLAKASEKNDYRQEIANRPRAKSMMEKFGS
jgi:hypothetical protein